MLAGALDFVRVVADLIRQASGLYTRLYRSQGSFCCAPDVTDTHCQVCHWLPGAAGRACCQEDALTPTKMHSRVITLLTTKDDEDSHSLVGGPGLRSLRN